MMRAVVALLARRQNVACGPINSWRGDVHFEPDRRSRPAL